MPLVLSSAQTFEAELVLPLKPSLLLQTFLLALHILIIASVCFMPLAWVWKLGLILGILLVGFYEWRKQPSLGYSGFKQLIWRESGGWELETAQGKFAAIQLTQHFNSSLLTILHVQVQAKVWVVLLLPDNLDPVSRQLLHRRLKLIA